MTTQAAKPTRLVARQQRFDRAINHLDKLLQVWRFDRAIRRFDKVMHLKRIDRAIRRLNNLMPRPRERRGQDITAELHRLRLPLPPRC